MQLTQIGAVLTIIFFAERINPRSQTMNRTLPLIFAFVALLTFGCNPKNADSPAPVPKSDDVAHSDEAKAIGAETQNDAAQETGQNAEKTDLPGEIHSDNTADDEKCDETPDEGGCGCLYGKLAKTNAVPLPKIDGKPVQYIDGFCQGNYNAFRMENFDFRNAYEKDLAAAGFENSSNAFVKNEGTPQEIVVAFIENKDDPSEPYVLVIANSRDRYKRSSLLPDKRIPYPLDKSGLGAYPDEIVEPDEASNETVFVYESVDKAFVGAYQKRLESLGFANVRIPEAPLYTKSVDGNAELSVAIDFDNDAGLLRVKMMVIRLN